MAGPPDVTETEGGGGGIDPEDWENEATVSPAPSDWLSVHVGLTAAPAGETRYAKAAPNAVPPL